MNPSAATPEKIQLTIESPAGERQTLTVRKGLGMQAVCARQVTPIEFDCREADCGICIFRVLEGQEHLSHPTRAEADFLKAMGADPEERLACQCRVHGDMVLKVEY